MDEFRCPKCAGHMEEGWLPDDLHGSLMPMKWARGRPSPNPRASRFQPDPGYLEPEAGNLVPIVAYACGTCGFMEFYARRSRVS